LAAPPAEFYPECAQLKITGTGTVTPGPEVRSTLGNAYKPSLPELTQSYNYWKARSSQYKFPGPAVFSG